MLTLELISCILVSSGIICLTKAAEITAEESEAEEMVNTIDNIVRYIKEA